MPHLVLEHSADLGDEAIRLTCEALFQTACNSPVFANIAAIKIRSIPCRNVHMGTKPQSFAHLTVWMLSGRDTEQKKTLANDLLNVMDQHLPNVGVLTVDPRDMDSLTYAKRVI